MQSKEVLAALETLAADQWGIITTQQAARSGISRLWLSRLVEQGVVTRVRRGVYLLPSFSDGPVSNVGIIWVSLVPEKFLDERWKSASWQVVSHETAADIHGIGDLIAGRYTFSANHRKQSSQGDVRIYNNRFFYQGDVVNKDGLPVTSVERTVCDLAENEIEFNYLARIIVDALGKEGVRLRSLASRLDSVAGKYGYLAGWDLIEASQAEMLSDEDVEDSLDRARASLRAAVLRAVNDNRDEKLLRTNLLSAFEASIQAQHGGKLLE